MWSPIKLMFEYTAGLGCSKLSQLWLTGYQALNFTVSSLARRSSYDGSVSLDMRGTWEAFFLVTPLLDESLFSAPIDKGK